MINKTYIKEAIRRRIADYLTAYLLEFVADS